MVSPYRLLVVTPCRDEAQFAKRTIESVASQTAIPTRWIIVDDGSSDETPSILTDAAREHAWISLVLRENRGKRSVGPGVVDAFYAGLELVDLNDFDFICKLDLDLVLPPRYFETLIQRMLSMPEVGTCSGKPYFELPLSSRLVSEKIGDEMSAGMTKLYRTHCFQDIGGFVREVMWDGIDCHRCRMNNWIACSWDDPELRFLHLRPMGSSQTSIWSGRLRHGYGQYFMGTSLLYMTASAIYRMSRPPIIVGGLGMWWGFVRSWMRRLPRYQDQKFRSYLRRYQWQCLLRGKRLATEAIHQQIRQMRRLAIAESMIRNSVQTTIHDHGAVAHQGVTP